MKDVENKHVLKRLDSIDNSLKRIATALEWIVSDLREFKKDSEAGFSFHTSDPIVKLYQGDVVDYIRDGNANSVLSSEASLYVGDEED